MGTSQPIFYTQVGVTAAIMAFCIAMLAKGESASIYLPVLTGISGWWLPSPNLKKDEVAVQPAPINETVVEFVGKKVAEVV